MEVCDEQSDKEVQLMSLYKEDEKEHICMNCKLFSLSYDDCSIDGYERGECYRTGRERSYDFGCKKFVPKERADG